MPVSTNQFFLFTNFLLSIKKRPHAQQTVSSSIIPHPIPNLHPPHLIPNPLLEPLSSPSPHLVHTLRSPILLRLTLRPSPININISQGSSNLALGAQITKIRRLHGLNILAPAAIRVIVAGAIVAGVIEQAPVWLIRGRITRGPSRNRKWVIILIGTESETVTINLAAPRVELGVSGCGGLEIDNGAVLVDLRGDVVAALEILEARGGGGLDAGF